MLFPFRIAAGGAGPDLARPGPVAARYTPARNVVKARPAWYNTSMVTAALLSPDIVEARVAEPSAIAGKVESAVYAFARVIIELVHANPAAFAGENQVLEAVRAVEKFSGAFVSASALPALVTGSERAPVEDVSLRKPPPGVSYGIPSNTPQIDYAKLAMYIVAAQEARAEQLAEASALAAQTTADVPVITDAAPPNPVPPAPAPSQVTQQGYPNYGQQ